MKLSSSIKFALVLAALWLAIASVSGTRKSTAVVPDVASTAYSETKHGDWNNYTRRVHDPNKHIAVRQIRYYVLGGILQALAEQTQIPREDILKGGASQYQDQSSGLGREIHAAHVNRVGKIDSRLKQKNAALNTALQNYIGHTQNVIPEANVWHGVAGQIDRFQSNNLVELAKIDFGGAFEPTNRPKVEDLMKQFQNIIEEYVKNGKWNNKQLKQLNEDKITAYFDGALTLFQQGKYGYDMVKNGEFKTKYHNVADTSD